MSQQPSLRDAPDIVLPDTPAPMTVSAAMGQATANPATPQFDAGSTTHFQTRMPKAPEWFCSALASNTREKRRLADELRTMKGAWPLLMKQRDGGKWSPEEKVQLRTMVRSASSVSPYLFIWALPGSVVMLPFLAWFLDKRRKHKQRKLSA